MQIVYRYRIKPQKAGDFIDWLDKNRDNFVNHAREGWTYEGTWFTVQSLADYDAESRWELDDYAALGSDFGDETSQRLIREFLFDWIDDRYPLVGTLMKSEGDVRVLEGS